MVMFWAMRYDGWDIGKWTSSTLLHLFDSTLAAYPHHLLTSPHLTSSFRPDCTILPKLWGPRTPHHPKQLFVDIGANLGSCSLVMSAHGAHVLSFEPQVDCTMKHHSFHDDVNSHNFWHLLSFPPTYIYPLMTSPFPPPPLPLSSLQPSNLFYFKSSLSSSYLSNNIQLFPFGLGNITQLVTMYTQDHNQVCMCICVY